MTRNELLAGCACAGLMAVLAAPCSSQAEVAAGADAGGLQEVVVTARKREERVQDVPASIAAATGQTLTDLNITNATQLSAIAPGLTFATDPTRFGSGPGIALRGISTQTQSLGVQDSVGTVIDGVPITRAKAGAFPDLTDIARVEVLRGPQGTLFGLNASAGLISYMTKDPTEQFQGEARVGYGTFNDVTASAAVSGPIAGQDLLGRLSVYTNSRDGYIYNIHDGTYVDPSRQNSARLKLVGTPSAQDKVKLFLDYSDLKNEAGAQVVRKISPLATPDIVAAQASIAGPQNTSVNVTRLGDGTQKTGGVGLQWDHEINGFTVTSISSYRLYDQDAVAGTYLRLTPQDKSVQDYNIHFDQYSSELRLASPSGRPLQYVTGAFILHSQTSSQFYSATTPDVPSGVINQKGTVELLNYALFGEADYQFGSGFSATAGARWTNEKVDLHVNGIPVPAGYFLTGHPLQSDDDSAKASNVSWRLSGQYKVAPDVMLYAQAATGFKGPAFNSVPFTEGDTQKTRPEKAMSYEAGIKSQFLDRRLTFNLTAFHATYKDFQTQASLLFAGSNVSRVVITNAGELQTQGAELEFDWAIRPSTRLSLNGAYIDATYKDFKNAPCYPGETAFVASCVTQGVQDLSGSRLASTPKWSGTALLNQDFSVPGFSWKGRLNLDYSWRSSVQWSTLGSPDGIEGAYGLLGAAISFESPDGRLTARIYGRNLTDQFHTNGITVGTTVNQFIPYDYRRILGVEATARF